MKIIHSTIGILLIVFGCALLSITVFDEEVKTVVYKIWGAFIVVAGTFYLKKIAKFGKQQQMMFIICLKKEIHSFFIYRRKN